MLDDLVIRPTVTTTATAYSAGDCVGGIITLAAVGGGKKRPVRLRSICLKDDINQKPSLQLLFFRSSPAGTYTDNAAVVVGTADMGALLWMHVVAAADWTTINGITKAVASYELDNGPILGGAADDDLYMVIVATATPPDYNANATDFTMTLGFERV